MKIGICRSPTILRVKYWWLSFIFSEAGCPGQRWVENKGNCYLVVRPSGGVGRSWAVANSECQARQKDAFLTSIENKNENDFISSKFLHTFELRMLIFFNP